MPIKIKDVKTKEFFWALKKLSLATIESWKERVSYLDAEYSAEYKLALAKSKRISEDIEKFSEIDLDLNWGCERLPGERKGYSVTKKTGDFNPWYDGDLTLDELVQALADLHTFYSSSVEPMPEEIDFTHYYEYLEKIYSEKKPKYHFTPETFWEDIHPDIVNIAKPRYESGQYADAVESSLKHVNSIVKKAVKKKTGVELDGADLMNKAFSLNNPVIVLEDLQSESGKNVQVGYMQIFAGSMTGIRNPKAHDNIQIEKKWARHLIFLASLLLFKFERGKLLRNKKI